MIIDDLRRQDAILTHLYNEFPVSKSIDQLMSTMEDFSGKGMWYVDRLVGIMQVKGLVTTFYDRDFDRMTVSLTDKGCERAEEVLVEQYRDAKHRGL